MRIYRHWRRATKEFHVDGGQQIITCYGGSNASPVEALQRAEEKIARIEQKIRGEEEAFCDYEVDIREEIIKELNREEIVTRNRYGALVLNAEKMMIVDVDEPVFGLLDRLFGRTGEAFRKPTMLRRIEKVAARQKELCFRVYETFKGYRVIVLGKDFDARSFEARHLMASFAPDPLYASLCVRQNCYRARLTPKPGRVAVRAHRVLFPRDEQQTASLAEWLKTYEQKSRHHATCRHVITIGRDIHSATVNYHDEITRAFDTLPLA